MKTTRTPLLALYIALDVLFILLLFWLGPQYVSDFPTLLSDSAIAFWFWFLNITIILVYGTQLRKAFPHTRRSIIALYTQKVVALALVFFTGSTIAESLYYYALTEYLGLLFGLSIPLMLYRWVLPGYLWSAVKNTDMLPIRLMRMAWLYISRPEFLPVLLIALPLFVLGIILLSDVLNGLSVDTFFIVWLFALFTSIRFRSAAVFRFFKQSATA